MSPYLMIFADAKINIHQDVRPKRSVSEPIRRRSNMKNKIVKAFVVMMSVSTITMMGSASVYASETETETATEAVTEAATEAASEDATEAGSESDDQAAADNVAALIDKIYVQERREPIPPMQTVPQPKKHGIS